MQRSLIIGYRAADRGEDAIALGAALAERLEMKPVVATVIEWPGAWLSESDLQELVRKHMGEQGEALRERLAPLDAEVRYDVSSSPALGLRELAFEKHAGLIVISSTHRSAFGQAMLGSTGESLLTDAPCAVAVAAMGSAKTESRFDRIAVAYDGSPESQSALRAGIDLARRSNAKLTLVGVMDFTGDGYADGWAEAMRTDPYDLARKTKRQALEHALASVPSGVEASSELLSGAPGYALAQASHDHDLMVVGSRGYGRVRRTVAGSSTRRLLREALCHVVVTPRSAGSDPLHVTGNGYEEGADRERQESHAGS
ncbi:universal stress protein [Thermoleophilia bacterium SCSIO 60948]|nr:universal stress protein [Thermoleophilia bacterium SCSIO 60948]